jgi:hypothetical protein
MEQEEEIRERVLREFNSSTLDDVGPLEVTSGISIEIQGATRVDPQHFQQRSFIPRIKPGGFRESERC